MTRRRVHQNNGRKPTIVGTGLIALDIVVSESSTRSTQRYAGGTCGNVSTILAFLGWDAFPIARTNGDFTSQWVREDLARFGVRTDYLSVEPTGPVPAIIEWLGARKDGTPSHRYSFVCPTCGSRKPGHKPIPAKAVAAMLPSIETPDVFFFDRVSRAAIVLAKEFRANGSLIVFEPSGVGEPKLFREALALTHLLKYSTDRMGDVMKDHRRDGVRLEIETLGEHGLRFRSRLPAVKTRGWKGMDAFPIKNLKDAAGAGDWLTGALLNRTARCGAAGFSATSEKDLLSAFRFAQAAAAWNCGFEAPRGGMYCSSADDFIKDVSTILLGKVPARNASRLDRLDGHKTSPDGACLHCQSSRVSAAVAPRRFPKAPW
jgi:sugar/nucleoside kinase (ribokinase family)